MTAESRAKFAAYVQRTKFSLELSQPMISTINLFHKMGEMTTINVGAHMGSVMNLERRGLVEYSLADPIDPFARQAIYRLTQAGIFVHGLLVEAGLNDA